MAGGSTNYSWPSELWRLFSAPLGGQGWGWGWGFPCPGWFPNRHVLIITQGNTPRTPFEALWHIPAGSSLLSHFGLPGFLAPFLQLQGDQEAPPGFLVPALQPTDSLGSELKGLQGSPRLFPYQKLQFSYTLPKFPVASGNRGPSSPCYSILAGSRNPTVSFKQGKKLLWIILSTIPQDVSQKVLMELPAYLEVGRGQNNWSVFHPHPWPALELISFTKRKHLH